ncbi:hypothetical protein PR202_gb23558 [Eleusine coracana subsp. coracana]|uniref:GPI transamidase component PIG-T n=1 Tax=Eleusine coracana subsp. coracana TaxID=191504 RepID=A0AAV5FGK5_ELECO|nr:hypothetical protein PR202_gb23558 [Eleusine coracana subsp. coracana]
MATPPTLSVWVSFLLFLLFLSSAVASEPAAVAEEEEFTEELLLRPLPDRKALAHFHFRSSAPPSAAAGRHHHIFPKAISQLVQKFHISELELSFTQGRWNYEQWGGSDPMSTSNAKPPGVELWAVFDLPLSEIDATWKNLTHTLSGLFCASINFLESSTSFSAPQWGFKVNEANLRYGALPREAVCTENLTPWLKLLPCRDKAGIASLLYRPSIYKGYYHSQKLKLRSSQTLDIVLDQTLTVVLQPNTASGKQHIQLMDNFNLTEDKLLPGTLEMLLRFPCGMQSATLTLDFDKGFLHIDEYPPDANQGFDIPSALVSFPEFSSARSYPEIESSFQSPLLEDFQEDGVVKSYTEVLLVPLTTPDFSMPYNVITFTCTVLALYFGSLLNALRRRIGEEERELKKSGKD